MKQAMYIIQIAISLLLMTAILLQAKGTGLGHTFGGVGEFYHSKRGIEKMLFKLTIILAIIFLAVSMASAMI